MDAAAIGPDGGVIFEVLFKRDAASREKAAALAGFQKKLVEYANWDLQVILLPAPRARLVDSENNHRILEAARVLAEQADASGSEEIAKGAYTLAFSALEWALANWAKKVDIDYRPNASQLGASLVSEGLITEERYEEIRQLQDIRNSIVHARSLSVPITGASVVKVVNIAEWAARRSEHTIPLD
ncbi:hypothetical protein ACIQI8_28770 [Streptomyces sp. NPDC092369]|uniref:hypothetical protein n=1 Tax=Streptomyces sp. NPDC092369 TaxID=3366015 RepID=UPI0037F6F4C2